MNPAFLDEMSWEMAEVYGAVNDQILINLAKYFPWFDKNNLPASSFAYQAKMLAQMGKINRETISIIKRNLTGANEALGNMLEQAIIDAIESTEPELVEAVKKGIFSPAGMPIVAPNQMRAYQLYYQQAAQKLNLVNTVMLESTQSAYQQAVSGIVAEIDLADRLARTQQYLDIAAGETITGVSSWNTALRHAMDRLTTGGITGFVDHAGRQWSAEAYVAMDIRTTVFNTGRAAVWETNQNFGNDLYIVSYHNGARPLCYPWQNKVISSTDNARTVTDLDGNEIQVIAQSDTSYGQAAGLFGINCKHHPDPFIPGVSVIHGEPQNKEENDRVYAESQEQRALERKIREQKRDLMIMKEQGATPEEIKAQRAKIRQTDDEIDEFCEKTGRARRQNREGVYTKREFPDANKYDVAAFERKQKDLIGQYYQNGGEQQGYTFGQMEQKRSLAPNKKVFTSEEEFDSEISRLRELRSKLFDQDSYDKQETDRLMQDIFDLEDKKKEFAAQKAKEALDASVITTRPVNEPENLKQFKRFDVSKRTDAQMLEQVNPNYTTHKREWTYNCQRAVAAQEAIYRGYDVTAMGYHARDAIGDRITGVFVTTPKLYEDPNLVLLGNGSTMEAKLQEAFAGWGDGSRGVVRLYWNKENGSHGHFIYARNVGGKIILSDPQSGKFIEGGISSYTDRVTRLKQEMWVMRVDDRPFTDNVGLAMKDRSD